MKQARLVLGGGLFLLAAAVGTAMTPTALRNDPTLELEASISQRLLTVKKNGEVFATYSVSVGTDVHPTPRGRFNVRKIVWNPGWTPPPVKWARGLKAKEPWHPSNPMQAVKIFFKEPDYYIHGTPYTNTLGTASSHGCLRMAPADAAEVGRMVMEHGGVSPEPSWWEELAAVGRSKTVQLPSPVTLSVVE